VLPTRGPVETLNVPHTCRSVQSSRTVSVKPIATLTEQCSQCGLWFEFTHLGADGRFLCSVCIRLEGGNRAAPPAADFVEERVGR
jgi:hypothetical protein